MFSSSKDTTVDVATVAAPIVADATTTDMFSRFRSVVPTKKEVLGALTGAVPEGVVISPEEARRHQAAANRSSNLKSGGVLSHPVTNLLALAAASACSSYVAFSLYRNWNLNYANLTIMETVHLPSETTDSFVELSIPLEGEVRLACSLLSRCKFILRLNASLKPTVTGSPHSRSRSRRLDASVSNASVLSGAASSRASFSSRNGGNVGKVVVQNVEMNEICDAWQSEETGRLHFAPSSCSDGTVLMRYKAESHDNFQSPLCIKQCWVQPASAPNAHRLSYELFVHGACMDVAVTIIFPKGAQILSVDTQGVGHWQNAGPYAPNEIVWHVGSYSKEKGGVESAVSAVGGLLGGNGAKKINHAGNVQYDSVAGATGANGSEAPMNGEGGEQQPIVLNGDLPLASIRFQAVYAINAIPQTEGEVKANRKERRRQEKEQKKEDKRAGRRQTASVEMEQLRQEMEEAENAIGNAVEFDPIMNVPAVCVAFTTNTSTSGVAVKQLKSAEEQVHYDMLTDIFGGADYWSKEQLYRRGESARERFTRRTIVNAVSLYGFARDLAVKAYKRAKGEHDPFLYHEELVDEEEAARRRQKVADAAVRRFEGRGASVDYKLDSYGNYVAEDRLANTGKNELFGDPEEHLSATSRGAPIATPSNPYSGGLLSPRSNGGGADPAAAASSSSLPISASRVSEVNPAYTAASGQQGGTDTTTTPLPARAKISKRVRYITNFIQQIRVIPNY